MQLVFLKLMVTNFRIITKPSGGEVHTALLVSCTPCMSSTKVCKSASEGFFVYQYDGIFQNDGTFNTTVTSLQRYFQYVVPSIQRYLQYDGNVILAVPSEADPDNSEVYTSVNYSTLVICPLWSTVSDETSSYLFHSLLRIAPRTFGSRVCK